MVPLSDEYAYLRGWLKDVGFPKSAKAVVAGLEKVLQPDGPDKTQVKALEDLRKACAPGFLSSALGTKSTREADALLKLASDEKGMNMRVAVLKTARHLHLVAERGGHCLWVLALPRSYKDWAGYEFAGIDRSKLRAKLLDIDEYWAASERKLMAQSSQTCVRWAHRAMALLAGDAADIDPLVRRWFADEDTTDDDVKAMKAKLLDGFKKIASAADSGRMIFAENPGARGGKNEKDEAFVYIGERLNVVYIESDFFGTKNVLSGAKNWARIVVHELSHTQVGTDDVPGRYAWGGLQPWKGGFSSAQAMTNADSWAFFCADCNGELTEGDRARVLKKT